MNNQGQTAYFKPHSQATQNCFLKQYQDLLKKKFHKTNDHTRQSNHQSTYSPLFSKKSTFTLRPLQISPSPKRSNCSQSYVHTENSTRYQSEGGRDKSPLMEKSFGIDKSPVITKSSNCILKESDKKIEENQIANILGIVKNEKQQILKDIKTMTKQMNTYKNEYEQIVEKKETLLHKINIVKNPLVEHPKDNINETYSQMITLLRGLQVDHSDVLPILNGDIEQPTEEQRTPDKDEVLILQKLIIKKLVKKIEDQRQLNSLLQCRMKGQQ